MDKVHYKRAIEIKHDEDNCPVVELHNSWDAWWTKAPSLDVFWLHSWMGQEPVAARPQSRWRLGTLYPLAQEGRVFSLFISLPQLKAISANAFLPSFLFRRVRWALTRAHDMLFYEADSLCFYLGKRKSKQHSGSLEMLMVPVAFTHRSRIIIKNGAYFLLDIKK